MTDVRAKLIAAGVLKNTNKPIIANQDAIKARRMENKGLKEKTARALAILERTHATVH